MLQVIKIYTIPVQHSALCNTKMYFSVFLFLVLSLGRSQLPSQGLNPGPQQRECRVLTTGPTGLSPSSRVQIFVTPWTVQPARLLCPWDSPAKITGVGCHFLHREIFLTQISNPCLLHVSPAWAGGFLTTSATWEDPQGSPRILQLTAYGFLVGSDPSRCQ